MKKSMKNSEAREFLQIVKDKFSIELSRKDRYETDDKLVLINGQPMFFYYEKEIIPTLKFLLQHDALKKITVDMGAVKFIVKGADIMRPGITKIDENIQKNEIIVVVDETHNKPLAVGRVLFNSEELNSMNSGNVIKNIHYVGDETWKR
ncbi:MAG: RNA-binding protein [Nanoarchaeota archaeon]